MLLHECNHQSWSSENWCRHFWLTKEDGIKDSLQLPPLEPTPWGKAGSMLKNNNHHILEWTRSAHFHGPRRNHMKVISQPICLHFLNQLMSSVIQPISLNLYTWQSPPSRQPTRWESSVKWMARFKMYLMSNVFQIPEIKKTSQINASK